MRLFRSLVFVAIAMSPALAKAQGVFDARLVSSGYELEDSDSFDDIESEGNGFEVRGHFDFTSNFFGRASYLITSSDEVELNGVDVDADLDSDVLRLGFGFQNSTDALRFYGAIEFADATLELGNSETDDDGFILSGGLSDLGEGAFLWNVELGLVQLSDADGAAFSFDLGYRVTPNVAILLGGQGYSLEDDFEVEYSLSHGSLGIRVTF